MWVVKTVPARTASRASSKSRPGLGELADALQAEEAGVALVGVEDLGGGVAGDPAVGADGPDPADAEQHLLQQPVLAAAAVEPVGDVAVGGVVLLDVGVEQQQRDPADLRHPDLGVQHAPPGRRDGTWTGVAVRLLQQGQRQAVGVERRVVLLLPAVAGQGLAEVAVPVEQADADDRHAEVAGRLEVVAGEDAEAAGVLRQGGGDAELGREVGDGRRARRQLVWYQRGRGHVVAQVVGGVGEPAQEAAVGGELGAAARASTAPSSATGSAPDALPGRRVDLGKGPVSPGARTSAGSSTVR